MGVEDGEGAAATPSPFVGRNRTLWRLHGNPVAAGEGGTTRSRARKARRLLRSLSARETNEFKPIGTEMSPRGGSRPCAGRPPVQLTTLVLEGRFRWQNRRHRAALRRDELDLPADYPRADVLEEVRVAYRRQPWGAAASSLAQYFEGRSPGSSDMQTRVLAARVCEGRSRRDSRRLRCSEASGRGADRTLSGRASGRADLDLNLQHEETLGRRLVR
jgi:hypothetical protein